MARANDVHVLSQCNPLQMRRYCRRPRLLMPPSSRGITCTFPVCRFRTLLAAHVQGVELHGLSVCSMSVVYSLHMVPF